MGVLEAAAETQLCNIEGRTGLGRDGLIGMLRSSGLARHGELLAFAKAQWGLGHGDANLLAHLARAPEGGREGDPLDAIYAGGKAALRALHERLMGQIAGFGPFEVAPKKGYVSLRRARQFAMLGPKNSRQIQLGINLKEELVHPLVAAEKPGGMCQWTALLTLEDEVDAELLGLVRRAYEAAG